jgi:predicted dehydrogenase
MSRTWKVAVVKDTAKPMLGLHGLHAAFPGLPRVEVVAHVDSNAANLDEKLSCTQAKRHYLTCDEMLERESPDIVVLTSRHPADHFPHIRAAAERGVHVYCEKPMTADLKEADEIIALVERSGIKLCVAHPSRYGAGILTMKHMLESGEIGTPISIHGRGKNDHRGGGEDLIVLGTHILDIQTFFFGAPEYVTAEVLAGGSPIRATDRQETVEPIGPAAGDEIFASFHFANGVRGLFESKRGYYDSRHGMIHMGTTVIGTKGALSLRFSDVPGTDAPVMVCRQPCPLEAGAIFEPVPLQEDRFIPGAEPLDASLFPAPWFGEANRFAALDLMQAIQADRQPISNAWNARLVLEMIYGIYRSSLTRALVEFPLAERCHPLQGKMGTEK